MLANLEMGFYSTANFEWNLAKSLSFRAVFRNCRPILNGAASKIDTRLGAKTQSCLKE